MRRRSLRSLTRPLSQPDASRSAPRPCGNLSAWRAPRTPRSARRPGWPAVAAARRLGRARRTPPASRCAGSRCAGSTVPVLPPGHGPLQVLHVSRPAPDARPRAASGRGCAALADLEPDLVVNTGDNLAHLDVGAAGARRASAPCSTCPASSCSAPTTTSRRRCATRCATCCPTTASATPTPPSCPGGDLRAGFEQPRLGRPHQPARPPDGRGHDVRLRRRRRPAPGLRRPGRGRRSGRRRRPTCAWASPTRRTSGCSTSSPPTATTTSSPGTPTAASCACRSRAPWSPTATSTPARAKGLHRHPADSRPGDPGVVLAARLGRARAPRRTPRPVLLPARGHPAHAHPARREPGFVARPDRRLE